MSNAEKLPFVPTERDWWMFYDFCKRQALLGVGFTVVEKVHEQCSVLSEDMGQCPKDLRLKWMAVALKIEERNRKMSMQCRELTERLEHDGLRCCILKGQGNLLNYPEHLKQRRNPGDIDVWCAAPAEGLPVAVQIGQDRLEYVTYHGRRAVREYIMMQHRLTGNEERPNVRYHHIEAPDIDGLEVELHFRVGYINSPLRNRKMQRWFDEQADVCMKNKNHHGFATPTPSVNVVYQMTHLFTHYFDEGLGLRQLMDYYFILKVWSEECGVLSEDRQYILSHGMWSEGLGVPVMSKDEVMNVLHSFGMGKFAAAVMWVLHEVFAMPAHYYICEPNEREGQKLLAEIMQGGNFGQYDERGKAMRNGGTILHAIWKLKRVTRLVSSYPEEALCEPFFRVWHWGWRLFH